MGQKKFWRKAILIFTCIALIAGGTAGYLSMGETTTPVKVEQSDSWKDFTPKNQRFNARFPSEPKEISKEVMGGGKKIQYHEFRVEEKDSIYVVSYIDFPGHWKWLGTKKLLNKSFDMFLQSEANIDKVMNRQISSQGKHTSLKYKLKQEGKIVQGKFLVAGNTLYRVTASVPLAAAEEDSSQNFIDSFEIRHS